MKVSALLGDRAELKIDFAGGPLNLVYRPSVLLPSFRSNETMTVPEALCALVSEWDAETEDGAPLPLTLEALEREVPSEMQAEIYTAILGDFRPNLTRTQSSKPS